MGTGFPLTAKNFQRVHYIQKSLQLGGFARKGSYRQRTVDEKNSEGERLQGGQVLQELQRAFNDVRDPSEPLAHGAMILFAGALLLTPGFFTDAVGFALLIPAFRQAMFATIRQRVNVSSGFQATSYQPHQRRPHPETIDGEVFEVEDDAPEPRSPNAGPSGWTKH